MSRLTILTIALAAVLWPGPGGNTWAQQDDDSARTRQVLSCEEAARLSIARDRIISRSISGAQEPDPLRGGGGSESVGSFPNEMSRFEEDQRRRRLINDCLAQRGVETPAQ